MFRPRPEPTTAAPPLAPREPAPPAPEIEPDPRSPRAKVQRAAALHDQIDAALAKALERPPKTHKPPSTEVVAAHRDRILALRHAGHRDGEIADLLVASGVAFERNTLRNAIHKLYGSNGHGHRPRSAGRPRKRTAIKEQKPNA